MLSGRLLSYLKKRKISGNGHSLSLVVIRCHSLYQSLSFVVNDRLAYKLSESNVFTSNYYAYKISFLFVMILMILKHLLEQTIHFEKEWCD